MNGRSRVAEEKRAGFSDSAFYLGATLIGRGAHFLALPLLVRVMPPEQFGRLDLALVAVALVTTALLMGTDSGVAPEYARTATDDCPRLRGIFLASCQLPVLAGGAALLGVGLAHWSGAAPAHWFDLGGFVVACALLAALENCVVGLLRWTAQPRTAAVLIALNGVLPLAGVLAVAWYWPEPSITTMLAGLLAGHSLAVALNALSAKQVLRGMTGSRPVISLPTLFLDSWTLGLANLAGPTRRVSERLLVLSLLGEDALAAFAVLARVAQVLEIALQSLGNGYYPRALRKLDQPEGRQLALYAFQLYLMASVAGVLVLALAAAPVLSLMGGAVFEGDPRLLPVMGAFAAMSALPFCAGMAYYHRRQLALYSRMLLLSAVASLALGWAAMTARGTLAAWCLGLLGGSVLMAIVFLHASERLHPVGYRRDWVTVGLVGVTAVAVLPLVVGYLV